MRIYIFAIALFLSSCVTTVHQIETESKTKPSIDRDQVRQTIRDHIPEFKKCYDAVYSKNTKLAGKVVVDFQISDKGQVSNTEINKMKSDFFHEPLNTCVIATFNAITFPAAPKGTYADVTYPFLFKGDK